MIEANRSLKVMDGSKADSDLVLMQTVLLYCVLVIFMFTCIFQGQFP